MQVLDTISGWIFWGHVISFALSVCFLHLATLCHLVYLLERRLPISPSWRWIYVLGLVIYPTAMFSLYLFVLTSSIEWTGAAKLGWISMLDEQSAGLIALPIWLAAAAGLVYGLLAGKIQHRLVLAAIITLCVICAWTAFSLIFIQNRGGLALVPGLVLLGLVMLTVHACRRPLKGSWLLSLPWLVGLAATIVGKIMLAHHEYGLLPDTPPEGCFIVTAAARGHRRFVGSWCGEDGDAENLQLRRMRALEARLMQDWPRFHAGLRAVYNRVGPAVAKRIRSPYAADAMYVALKPMEMLAAFFAPPERLPKR